jgi:hypothetical protein
MLTVVAMLSGVHRVEWLRQALESIPLDCPGIERVNIAHQGGRWDWADALRARYEAHPKVRVLEYPSRIDVGASFSRHLDSVTTPWALLLPDDDFLIGDAFDRAVRQLPPRIDDCGLIAFGWYYYEQERARYVRGALRWNGLRSVPHQIPKMCATLINVARARELGGFSPAVGGYCDTVLFTQLAQRFGIRISSAPVAGYRLHGGQVSAGRAAAYGPYLKPTLDALGQLPESAAELPAIERRLRQFASGEEQPLHWLKHWVSTELRGTPQPEPVGELPEPTLWTGR